jgi:peptide/nickel transport system substrate-binding protein
MLSNKKFGWLALLAIAVLLAFSLVSCQTDATDTPAVEPGEPDVVEPEATSVPEPPAETSIIILLPDDPPSFNGVLTFTGYERLPQELMMLSVGEIDDHNNFYPELAAELPTIANGGVFFDEDAWTMDVTWTLRDDIEWEDGEPVTAEDVVFTWDAIADPEHGLWIPGMEYTDSVELIDEYSFIVHYNTVFPDYLGQFSMGNGFAVFPEHYCDIEQGYVNWDCNQDPLSNGPYILEEWARGDHLTFVRNPNYFEEGKPYIDKIFLQIVPEGSVRKTMLAEQVADLDFWSTTEFANELEPLDFIDVAYAPTARWLTHLWPNLAAKGEVDPVEFPHPIFSDVRVRQALRMGIDVDGIVAGIWPDGSIKNVWTEFFREPYVCDVPKPEYDPVGAAALLEEAGWTDTDGDGVRECNGCTTGASDGYEMSFELLAWSEFGESLILAQQLIAEDWKAIGADPTLTQEQGAVLWDTYENGGLEQVGNFDINLWDDGYWGNNPSDYLWYYYSSAAAVPDEGWNVQRWLNEEFDALLDETYTLDQEYATEVFCQMADLMHEEVPTIPLFDGADITIHNSRLQGIRGTVNAMVTWNVADWKVVE